MKTMNVLQTRVWRPALLAALLIAGACVLHGGPALAQAAHKAEPPTPAPAQVQLTGGCEDAADADAG